ncbi:MAG: hypothetical protein JNL82_09975 [Myxococcales bacterium]|nr:hypothetical protein [Myxococcales bacterium]
MAGPIDMRPLLAELGVGEHEARHVIAGAAGSWARLVEIRRALAEAGAPADLAVFAVGSLGRFESSTESDLDFAVVYHRDRLALAAAQEARVALAERLRPLGYNVSDKTFGNAVDLRALLEDIGGQKDTNIHLTYRALLLTEGAWLANAAAADAVTEAIFAAYAQGAVTRGKFLSSLQNDLHRYYRTICVDYRFKVEVDGKHWAIRYFKLRNARKLWHLANLTVFCRSASLPDEARDEYLARALRLPSLVRVAEALRALGGLWLCAELVRAYDGFLAALADPEVRRGLDLIDYATREEDRLYVRMHEVSNRLDAAAQAVVRHLWDCCNEHLVRYGLL